MYLIDTFFNSDVLMSSLPALLRGFLQHAAARAAQHRHRHPASAC